MPSINGLAVASEVGATDMLPLYSRSIGGDVQVSVGTLVTFLQSLEPGDREITQYAQPGGSGFAAQVLNADDGVDIFYLLTPLGAYAAGSVILPSAPWDGQRVNVHCSQAVTAFTLTGATNIHGAPTTLAASGVFTMRWDAATSGWWRSA
jgi:hypothetical protein